MYKRAASEGMRMYQGGWGLHAVAARQCSLSLEPNCHPRHFDGQDQLITLAIHNDGNDDIDDIAPLDKERFLWDDMQSKGLAQTVVHKSLCCPSVPTLIVG